MISTIILSLNNGRTWDMTFFNVPGIANGTTSPTGWSVMDNTAALVREVKSINYECHVLLLEDILENTPVR